MKIVIIGSGISGSLAFNYLRSRDVEIYDAGDGSKNHHAIMRIRDPIVGSVLGCNIRRIKVIKGVYYRGEVRDVVTIPINNEYSIKTSGFIGSKSILNMEDSERYLIDFKPPDSVKYKHNLVSIKKGILEFYTEGISVKKEYDFCISTIPINSMISLVNNNILNSSFFESKPIFVIRYKLSVPSVANQTIYFPENIFNSYRASLEEESFIIESVCDFPCEKEIDLVLSSFGISLGDVCDRKEYMQKIGKMCFVNEDVRKNIIGDLTDDYSIYSLGRFAIWKPIRTDDVIKDLEKIIKLINYSEDRRRYESKLDKLHN